MFFSDKHSEVLVAGAGPVGLFSALLCRDRGLEVTVIDMDARTTSRSNALALHPRTLDLFEELGLAEALLEVGHRVPTIAFYEGEERLGAYDLGEVRCRHPYLLVLAQSKLEAALEARLREKGVEVQWSHRLHALAIEGDAAKATVQRMERASSGYGCATMEWEVTKQYEHRARFVLGADGHRSIVRRDIGSEYGKSGEPLGFALFEFEAEGAAEDEARVVFHDGTVSVLWPLGDGRFRWSFQVDPADAFDESREKSRSSVYVADRVLPEIEEEGLGEHIAARAPWFDATIGAIAWSLTVRFERALATKMGDRNVWLAGDAVHLGGPIGIHSMNLGFREARTLARLAFHVLREDAPVASFGRYAEEYCRDWDELFGSASTVRASAQAPDWVRKDPTQLLRLTPATGGDLPGLIAQLGLEF